jgi:hypothetical protein
LTYAIPPVEWRCNRADGVGLSDGQVIFDHVIELLGSAPRALAKPQPSPRFGESSRRALAAAARSQRHHPAGMFVVTEAEAAVIRAAFDRGGELSAAVELRRLFSGVTDNAQARECARTIAAWKPLPVKPRLVRLPGKGR